MPPASSFVSTAAFLLLLPGCAEVRVEDPTGGGGSGVGSQASGATSTTAQASTSTSGPPASGTGGEGATDPAGAGGGEDTTGSGGAGGGAPAHDPVPGCEELVWVGEPLVISGDGPHGPRVATLEGGDVGLVYADGQARLVSQRIPQPFSSWPPQIDAPVIAFEGVDVTSNGAVPVPARSDGTFARFVIGGSVIARFGEPSSMRATGVVIAVDAVAGGGAYQLRFNDAEDVFVDRLPSLSGELTPMPVGILPRDRCGIAAAFVQPEGQLLMATGPCGDDSQVHLLRATTRELEPLGGVPAPDSYFVHLVPRPGGAWLATTQRQGITVQPIDARGAVAGPVWSSSSYYGVVQMTPWRDGFAYVESVGFVPGNGVWLRVSDGWHATVLASWPDDGPVIRDVSVTASADGASLLVAHDVLGDTFLQRADCVPARRSSGSGDTEP